MKLGSLFDGSGGFPLAGVLNGITPAWASEIEPYPIAVTSARLPSMKHLGSITEINGGNIEPVDVITFGSPCQDLSIAGNQKGIENGARSSLFFQAIRIIKEMREATHGEYPRFAVWENVPGAFSSNHGNDFRLVLEALASISEPEVSIPLPEKGKWQRAGEIVGDGWSIAWRILDAQFWGVPQRRKRIYLVADFGSERAGEILFEREGVHGDPAQGGETREEAAGAAVGRAGGVCGAFCAGASPQAGSIGWDEHVSPTLKSANAGLSMHAVVYPSVCRTLSVRHDSSPCVDRGQETVCYSVDARNGALNAEKSGTVQVCGNKLNAVNPVMVRAGLLSNRGIDCGDCAETLRAGSHGALPILYAKLSIGEYADTGKASTMQARMQKSPDDLVLYDMTHANDVIRDCGGISPTLQSRMGTGGNQVPLTLEHAKPPRKYIVRRLTPTECARLQGFPDRWGDVLVKGKPHSDSAEYKMWGNGIALPCAVFVLGRIAGQIERSEPNG